MSPMTPKGRTQPAPQERTADAKIEIGDNSPGGRWVRLRMTRESTDDSYFKTPHSMKTVEICQGGITEYFDNGRDALGITLTALEYPTPHSVPMVLCDFMPGRCVGWNFEKKAWVPSDYDHDMHIVSGVALRLLCNPLGEAQSVAEFKRVMPEEIWQQFLIDCQYQKRGEAAPDPDSFSEMAHDSIWNIRAAVYPLVLLASHGKHSDAVAAMMDEYVRLARIYLNHGIAAPLELILNDGRGAPFDLIQEINKDTWNLTSPRVRSFYRFQRNFGFIHLEISVS